MLKLHHKKQEHSVQSSIRDVKMAQPKKDVANLHESYGKCKNRDSLRVWYPWQ